MFIKRLLTFNIFDVAGIILGLCLVHSLKDMDLFDMVMSPEMYILVFLSMFWFHSYIWVFAYRAENAYMKRMIISIFRDFFRISLASVSVIGIYFFIRLAA
ncbi:MAG: hypothetical protein J6P93_05800 [Alphaproteobacteria bacterium]|nr:hypothetical protein [Alphaproteobacteria bacterium]